MLKQAKNILTFNSVITNFVKARVVEFLTRRCCKLSLYLAYRVNKKFHFPETVYS